MKFIFILCALLSLSLQVNASKDITLWKKITHCKKIKKDQERLACFDTMAKPHTADKPPNTAETEFGFPQKQSAKLNALSTTIQGPFKGWVKGNVIKLNNGQQWKVVSKTKGYINLTSPSVTISNGFMGSFNMKVKDFTPTAKVRRIR